MVPLCSWLLLQRKTAKMTQPAQAVAAEDGRSFQSLMIQSGVNSLIFGEVMKMSFLELLFNFALSRPILMTILPRTQPERLTTSKISATSLSMLQPVRRKALESLMLRTLTTGLRSGRVMLLPKRTSRLRLTALLTSMELSRWLLPPSVLLLSLPPLFERAKQPLTPQLKSKK